MSFILDALRKSEHERQRSTLPGLAQVPIATPRPEMPRWAFVVIGALAVCVVALGVAWWQSTHAPAAAPPTVVERRVELPPPVAAAAADVAAAVPPPRQPEPTPPRTAQLADTAASSAAAGPLALPLALGNTPPPSDATALPSAAALAAEGIALPPLRLELHAYSERPSDRFVFINGRRYVEGEPLPEGPVLVAVAPRGAVLSHRGRQFLLVQE